MGKYKNILVRGGMSPLESFSASKIIASNSIGRNVGNFVYLNGVYRALMTEGTTLTPDYYSIREDRADYINENYDCYVLPLANAFRNGFQKQLQQYTALINKLTIPVVVIGIGIGESFDPKTYKKSGGFKFDDDARAFVKAVRNKSTVLGLRGHITAQYLEALGFKDGEDFTITGCPSMYTYGDKLNIKNPKISSKSTVCYNSSPKATDNVLDFINQSADYFKKSYFVPQDMDEMQMIYFGGHDLGEKMNEKHPKRLSDKVYAEDRVRFFLTAPSWINFMKKVDLSFGARVHGNITATLAGTPSIIIPKDTRMAELAEYHNLPTLHPEDITDKTTIEEVVKNIDFQAPAKKHKQNFDHYVDFLNGNGLDHIYKKSGHPTNTPYDKALKKVELNDYIKSSVLCTSDEMVKRSYGYIKVIEKKLKKLKERNKLLSDELNKKNARISKLKKVSDRRSVKLVLGVVNKINKVKPKG